MFSCSISFTISYPPLFSLGKQTTHFTHVLLLMGPSSSTNEEEVNMCENI